MARGLAWSPKQSKASNLSRHTYQAESRSIRAHRPEVGDPAIRERFAYSYRIIYRLEPERVLVAAVIHGSRLLQPFVQRIGSAQKSNP